MHGVTDVTHIPGTHVTHVRRRTLHTDNMYLEADVLHKMFEWWVVYVNNVIGNGRYTYVNTDGRYVSHVYLIMDVVCQWSNVMPSA